jgi:hypothetical protein
MAKVKRRAQENVQIYVVGLKSDLPRSKEMEANVRAMLEQHELEAWRWITVSSKTGERMETPFYAAAVKHSCERGSSSNKWRPPTSNIFS